MGKKDILSNEVLDLLGRLDLNQYESKVYMSLLISGTATAGEISEIANVPRSRVYDVLNSLEKKGFAVVQVGRPVKYVAVPIENSIKQLKIRYEDEFNKKLQSVDSLEKNLRSVFNTFSKNQDFIENEAIRVIKGKSNLYAHMNKLIENSNNKILKMTNSYGLLNLDKHCGKTIEKAKKRGVETRIIANISEKPKLRVLHKVASLKKGNFGNGRFMISDGKHAIMLTSPDDSGIWIHSPYLASSLETLFETAWNKSKPIEF